MAKEKKHDVYMPLIIGDWLKGTRGMRANVRGVYLSLLLYQWDNGFIPEHIDDLVLIDSEVGSVWVFIFHKFVKIEDGKMQNEKLEEVRNFFSKQKKNGNKGGRPKNENPNHNPKTNPNHNLHNGVGVDNEIGLKEGGLGETLIIPSMLTTWKMNNPKAFIRLTEDSEQLFEIAQKISDWMGLSANVTEKENAEKIKTRWGEISQFLSKDDFLKKYSLVQINSHFSSVIQSFNNGHATPKQDHTHRAVITGDAKGAGSL
jgi:uncharacterized protein YdaU (DUF1376 family)